MYGHTTSEGSTAKGETDEGVGTLLLFVNTCIVPPVRQDLLYSIMIIIRFRYIIQLD